MPIPRINAVSEISPFCLSLMSGEKETVRACNDMDIYTRIINSEHNLLSVAWGPTWAAGV
jgi:hypothetical protein